MRREIDRISTYGKIRSAGELSFDLQRKGTIIPLTDSLMAVFGLGE